MGRLTEPLSGGLNTAKDPALLEPGQLSEARNTLLLPGSKALQRARGRSAFGTVSATAVDVVGLRDVQYDNGQQFLIAHASASYFSATAGDTGTFGVLSSAVGGVGSQLEVVQYRNRFFLFNGVAAASVSALSTNRVVYLSATATGGNPISRQHGMLPVVDSPQSSATAATFSQSVTGYYEYWTTEVARLTQDNAELQLESGFEGKPTTVYITTTAQAPIIQRPFIRNDITTHWRIYRSAAKTTEGAVLFPAGFMIAEIGTATAQQADSTDGINTGFIFPGSFNTSGHVYSTVSAQASAMASDNGVYAAFPVPTIVSGYSSPSRQGMYNFAFGGFSGAVKGIEVEVQAYISSGTAPTTLSVMIGAARDSLSGDFARVFPYGTYGGGSGVTNKKAGKGGLITSTAVGTPTTLTLGSSTDPWLAAVNYQGFVDTDFGTNFMAVIVAGETNKAVSVDYLRIKVYYQGVGDSTIQFPSVVYTFGDVTQQVSKNGPPPSSSTADIYQDCLVCNDVSNPSVIRWSYPGDPESFPGTYYLDSETRENDRVRLVKVVNSRLMVGLDSSIHRINYLPSERDASFDRGMASEALSKSYGVINPMCACAYSPEGGTERLAFVSDHGIHDTDAYDFRNLTEGIDWRATVLATSATSTPIALINDRDRKLLLFYFHSEAASYGNETDLCLALSYASEHMEGGRPKVCGILHERNFEVAGGTYAALKSAWAMPRSNGSVDVVLGYGSATAAGGGKVYRETGTSIPSNDSLMRYVTRRLYPSGLGGEWEVGDVHGYAGSYTGSPVVSYTVLGSKTNDSGETTRGTKSITLAGQKLHRVSFRDQVEGARVSAVITASAYAQELLIIDGKGFGLEDSGR